MLGGNAKFFGKFPLKHDTRGVPGANFFHLRSREFSALVRFAVNVSILLAHIAKIFRDGAERQVGRIDAPGVIAGMQDGEIGIDTAMCEQVGDAVGAGYFPFADLDFSILFPVKSAIPFPTIIRAAPVYLLPESFSEWARQGRLMTADIPALLTWEFSFGDLLTTTAGARLWYGIVRDTLRHVISSLLASGRTGGVSWTLPGILLIPPDYYTMRSA